MSSRVSFMPLRRRGPLVRLRRRSSLVRFTLLAPPSHLTEDEAAALLRLPRRTLRHEHEWLAPSVADLAAVAPRDVASLEVH